MFEYFNSLPVVQKFLAIAGFGLPAFVAENFADPKSLEAWGLKGILLVAVIFLVKTVLGLVKSHKAEIKELRDNHEQKFEQAIDNNTSALNKMSETLDKQVSYFEGVNKTLVDKSLKE